MKPPIYLVSVWLSNSVTVVLIILISLTIIIMYIFRGPLLYKKKQSDLKSLYEQEALQSRLEVQEQALTYISQEIHENIGQRLSIAKLFLNSVPSSGFDDNDEKIHTAINLLTEAIADLRNIPRCFTLNIIKDGGLVEAIQQQIILVKNAGRHSVEFRLMGSYSYMPEQTEIFLISILQEAVSNTIKHADANKIGILLDCRLEHETTLQINDNGKGFNISEYIGSQGNTLHATNGIQSMALRVQLIGGSFNLESSPTTGTKIEISIPNVITNGKL